MSGSDHDQVVGLVMPGGMGRHQVPIRQAVGVDEHEHVGVGVTGGEIAGLAGPVSVVLPPVDADLEPVPERRHRRLHLLIGAVVTDHDLHQVTGVGLSGQGGDGADQEVDPVVDRHAHRHPPGRAGIRERAQRAVVVLGGKQPHRSVRVPGPGWRIPVTGGR